MLTHTQSTVNYTGKYDSAGRVTGYVYSKASTNYSSGFTFTYTHAYQARDSYLESAIGGTGSTNHRATVSSSTYDAYGRRTSVTETTKVEGSPDLINKRYFANDAQGGILSRRDGYLKNGTTWMQAEEGGSPLLNPTPQWISAATWSGYSKAQREAVVANTKTQKKGDGGN